MTEADIIKGCMKEDRRSQNALYEKYYPLVSSITLRYCASEDEALQATNLGFLKVLQNIEKYNNEFALATWIRNVVVNHLIDEFRKNAKYKEQMEVTDHQEFEVTYDDEILETKWEEDELREMLRSLPSVTEKVFNLYAIDGYKHREIADLLNISLGTSKWHVSDARKRLKLRLTKQEHQEKKRIELMRNGR